MPPVEATYSIDPARALSILTGAVQSLSMARSLETIQRTTARAARALTGADGATFVLRDDDKCFYVDEDAIEPLWKGQRFPLEACISGWSMLNRQPVVIEDIYVDERIPASAYRPTFVKSLVMVPIRTLDPIGAIGMYWARHYLPSDNDIGLARALADSTAVALESVARDTELIEANRLADTDPLTGAANRRAWDAALTHAVAARLPVHVLLVDLDHFKRYNDTYGHPRGDELLRHAVTRWDQAVRDGDLVARIGGEEFGVLLTGCTAAQALDIAERLRTVVPEGQSASIGLATRRDGERPAELVERADAALYAAKDGGRNRVSIAD